MKIFEEKDGSFSWRKCLTAIVGFIFAFSVIGFLFGLPKLPTAYLGIISGVFGFYFTKELFTKSKQK